MKIAKKITLLLVLLYTLGKVSADMYIPLLPKITVELNTTPEMMKLSFTLYIATFACMQFIYGSLSDYYGRKWNILMSLCVGVVGNLMCAMAGSVIWLLIGRALQGAGTAAAVTLSRSIMRDLYNADDHAKYASLIGFLSIGILTSAPLFGAYIEEILNWRFSFIILLIYSVALCLLTFVFFPETNPRANKLSHGKLFLLETFKSYIDLFSSKRIIFFSFCSGTAYSGVVLFLSVSPFLITKNGIYNPVYYGKLLLFLAVGMILGTIISNRFIKNIGIKRMIYFGAFIFIICGLIGLCLHYYMSSEVNFSIILPATIYMIGATIIYPCSQGGAFSLSPQHAGKVASVYGCIQALSGALVVFAASLFFNHSVILINFSFILLGILCLAFNAIANHNK